MPQKKPTTPKSKPAKKTAVKKAAAKPAKKAAKPAKAAKKKPAATKAVKAAVKVAKKTTKKEPAKAVVKTAKTPAKKTATKAKPAAKPAAAAKPVISKKKAEPKAPVAKVVKPTKSVAEKAKPPGAKKKTALKKSASTTKTKGSASSSSFSLEEALSIAKKRESEKSAHEEKRAAKEKAQRAIAEAEQRTEKRVLGAASLADILGYNPNQATRADSQAKDVPKKFEKFYNLLVELRDHVKAGLNLHTEETLKRSSKDDSGDLSSYGQHMADAGTDTFDRDFALSMVSNEQEALHEIESAINRIFKGTYGVCEMTGKSIREERLMAVPFTRYSMATQAQLEKTHVRRDQRGGVFADASADDSIGFNDDSGD